MRKTAFTFLALLLLFTGCHHRTSVREMGVQDMAVALTRLTQSVDQAYYEGKVKPGMADGDILAVSTRHDPGLLSHFGDNVIRVKLEGKAAALLLCDNAGRKALVEDVACTPEPDCIAKGRRCDFYLDVNAVCAGAK